MGHSAAAWCFASLLGLGVALLGAPHAASGQGRVVRDGTVGPSAPEDVGPGTDPLGVDATYLITPELGEQHGSNLFHSFLYFDVAPDETATFTGPDPVEGPQSVSNVISRVTGGEGSQIDGTLRSTIPGADLWLLNPSGVMFGEGAELDVGGSFHAGTGDYVGFGEGELVRFYADPMRDSVLSTARPEAFGFLEESMLGPVGVTGALLEVDAGEAIELAGGDVTLTIATLAASGGAIAIRGGRIVVEAGSEVLAKSTPELPGERGMIDVSASESLTVDASLLSVSTASATRAGTIHVASPRVEFRNGPGHAFGDATVSPAPPAAETAVGASAETSGGGDGGLIDLSVGSLLVTRGASVSARTLGDEATGNAGTIRIQGTEPGAPADSVSVSERSDVSAGAWRSHGDGGDVVIDAHTVTVDGEVGYASIWTTSTDAFLDGGFTTVEDPKVSVSGAPGRIDVQADSVAVLNGGTIQSSCVDCSPVQTRIDVPHLWKEQESRLTGVGAVRIAASELVVAGENEQLIESSIMVNTSGGSGDAGWLRLEVETLELRDAGDLRAGTQASSGRGGLIQVSATGPVSITGVGPFTDLGSGIFSSTGTAGTGDAGEIQIEADSLLLASSVPHAPVLIQVTAGDGSSGNAGTIDISTRTLALEAGGQIRADLHNLVTQTGGKLDGNAGDIAITASESISISNEGGEPFSLKRALLGEIRPDVEPLVVTAILTTTVVGGEGGSIALNAPEITVSHGALVGSSTVGGGNGGPVKLEGRNIRIVDGGNVNSVSLRWPGTAPFIGGEGGDIELRASESIEVAGLDPHPEAMAGSTVTAATLSAGPAGNVTLRAPRIVIEGGGTVQTTALPEQGRPLSDARGGDITLVASDEVIVRSGGLVDASSFVPDPEERGSSGGDVVVTAGRSIRVGEGSRIESRTGGRGTGGDVTLEARRIEITGPGAVVSARSAPGYQGLRFLENDELLAPPPGTARGDAGAVGVTAHELRLVDGGTLAVDSEAADGGNIAIEAKRLVHLDAGEITAAVTDGLGGNITIDPEVVILQNGSRIVADAGAGDGGNIRITADNYFALPGSVVDASSDLGLDGVVEVNTPDVNLAGALAELPSNPLDAASQMKEPCAARRSGERAGSFAVRRAEGIPPEPDGWLPATVAREGEPAAAGTPAEASALLAGATCP